MADSVTVNKIDTKAWICAGLLFVISFPKWVWGFGANIMLYASLLLLLFAIKDINNKGLSVLGLVALLLQTVILWEFYVFSGTNLNGIFMVFIRSLGFVSIFLCSVDFWQKTTDCFIKLLAILLIMALIEHIMISFVDIMLTNPSNYECPINKDRMYDAFVFNVYHETNFGFFNRFYAFYDEPGVLGNILMVLLFIQRFNFKKWYNVVFFISGLFTFSLAFYIAITVYFVLFGSIRAKIGFGIATILAVSYFYNNDYIYQLLFRRITFENGTMVGYNRENADFNYWFNSINWHDFLIWGYKPKERVVYAASWKWAFARFGIVTTILYFITLVLSRIKHIRGFSDLLKCLVLLIIIWIQRPFVHLYLYAWLLVIPFIYLDEAVILPQDSKK